MKTISLFLFSWDAYLGRKRGQAYIYKQRNCSMSRRHVTWEVIYVDVSFDPHLSRAREGKADFYGPLHFRKYLRIFLWREIYLRELLRDEHWPSAFRSGFKKCWVTDRGRASCLNNRRAPVMRLKRQRSQNRFKAW